MGHSVPHPTPDRHESRAALERFALPVPIANTIDENNRIVRFGVRDNERMDRFM